MALATIARLPSVHNSCSELLAVKNFHCAVSFSGSLKLGSSVLGIQKIRRSSFQRYMEPRAESYYSYSVIFGLQYLEWPLPNRKEHCSFTFQVVDDSPSLKGPLTAVSRRHLRTGFTSRAEILLWCDQVSMLPLFLAPCRTTGGSYPTQLNSCAKWDPPLDRMIPFAATTEDSVTSTDDRDLPSEDSFSLRASAKVVAVVGAGTISPFSGASWEDVMQHLGHRLGWIDSNFEMLVFTDLSGRSSVFKDKFETAIQESNILVAISVLNEESLKWLKGYNGRAPTQISFDSLPGLDTWLGGVNIASVGLFDKLSAALFSTRLAESKKVFKLVTEAWERQSPDNVVFALLVLIDSYVSPVKLLKNLRATGLATLQCMIKNCGPQILGCLLDPKCRKALNCLNCCAPTDQVCSYRCIVSYESPQLEAFTLCVLQKSNCLGLSADILMQPDVQPMTLFRGQPLTHPVAEDLFVGWMDKLDWSWKVVAGQNAAYDHFPNQFQIFYRGKGKNSLWYDPVFQVHTLSGETVWRRRHYRVKRSKTPGTFFFSVLDNGVVSKEFWRIVDVTDELSWGLFYYSGAAEAAGQSYTGAVLVTPDGVWPDETQADRLSAALERCGIKIWELYKVDNTICADAPLGIPEESSLHVAI